MSQSKLHKDYLGHRLYPVGEDDFARDKDGHYVVHVLVGEIGSPQIHTVRFPRCCARTAKEAEKLSWEHGMRVIEEGLISMPKVRQLGMELASIEMQHPNGTGWWPQTE
jgi:hypothetical protein